MTKRKTRERLTDSEIIRLMTLFNLTYAEFRKLRTGFCNHRCTKRVPFLFTFEQWMKVWLDSGHWLERGARKGQYCMARFGDLGPYSVDNVKIILHSENLIEALLGNKRSLGCSPSKETRKLLSIVGLGNKRRVGCKLSDEHKAAIGAAARLNKHARHKWTPEEKLEIAERSRKGWEKRRKREKESMEEDS